MKEKRKMSKHGQEAERALQEAVADAIEEHRRSGNPIVVQRDGKLTVIDARKVRTVREEKTEYGSDQD